MIYTQLRTCASRLVSSLCAILLLLACASPALAQSADDKEPPTPDGIDIDIKGGMARDLTKIAVPEAKTSGEGADKIGARVTALIRKDLELAGYFELIPEEGLFFDPAEQGMGAEEINFKNWANVGAEGLVKSKVEVKKGKVALDLRLYLVGKGARAKLDFDASPVSTSSYEPLVHEFVNAMLEYYTGTRGIFGTQIAYVRRNASGLKQIWVMDMSGESVRSITNNRAINLLPSWGTGRIYYTSYKDQNPDLWVWDGERHRKLSGRRGQNSGASQCGDKLALTLSMGGENTDIYVIDPSSGKKVTRLTDHWAIDTSPTWSPDCSKIAFVSGRSSSPQIYVMNADGSDQRRLTYKGTYNTTPDWSPKGDVIAFTSRDERNAFDIFTVDLKGNIERLTQDQGNNEDPSFSPDGRYLVFTSDREGGKRIWLMTSDGQYQRAITEGSGYSSPTWAR